MKNYTRQFKLRHTVVIALIIIMSFLQTSTNLVNAFALQDLIELNMTSFLRWYALFLGIWLVYLAVLRIEKVQEQIIIQKMSTSIRHDISISISRLNYQTFHKKPSNIYASEYTNDLNMIEQSGFTNLYAAISSGANVVFAAIALLMVHYSLILTTLIMSLILISIPKFFSRRLQEANISVAKENGKFLGRVTDVLDGFNVLYSSGLSRLLIDKIESRSQKLEVVKVDSVRKQTNIEIVITFFNILAQFAIIVQTGVLAGLHIIPIGYLGATGGLAGAMFNGLGQFGNNLMQMNSIQPVLAKFQLSSTSKRPATPLSGLHSSISLVNIGYQVSNRHILNNFSAQFNAGGKYALLGPSGSGKSTLLNIINGRIQTYQGAITYDGVNYTDLNLENIRANMIFVDQHPYIFNETLRDNITLGQHYSDSQIQKAIKGASLQKLVSNLPSGLDTLLEKNGANLSGGEKQRITIARGIITGKKIILMDESTSALDEQAALDIENTLVSQPDTTLIMVTHHLRNSIRSKLTNVFNITNANPSTLPTM